MSPQVAFLPLRANIVNSAIIDFEEERSRHDQLFGRENVLDKLLRWLKGEESPSTKWVLLLGSPGVGKSAIVHELLNRLPTQTPYHIIRRGIENWDRPEAVVQNLCARIERIFPDIAGTQRPAEPHLGDLLRRVSRTCLVPNGKRLILVIDGLDEAASDGPGKNPLPRFLPRIVPTGVVLLCASRPMYPHLDWITSLDHVRTLDLDNKEWELSNMAATRELCGERSIRMSPPLTPEVIDAVVRSARGNMLYASRLCEWLDGQPPSRRTTAAIAQGLAELLRRIWSEISTPDGARHELVLRGLGLACAAREALPAYLLNELIGDRTAGDRDELLRAIRPLLREEVAHWHDDQPGYRLYHEHLREVLVERLGGAVIREHHHRFIEVLAGWPPDDHDPARRRYAARHAVAHRLEAGDVRAAQRLCANTAYLEAKCKELDIVSAERELEAVIAASEDDASLDLAALLAALRAEASRISAHPKALPALLYNRLRCTGWSAERIGQVLGFGGGLPPLRLLHGVRLGPTPLRAFLGHEKPITACSLSRDGRHVLSASADRTLRYWALVSGEVLATMQGHEDELTACAITPDAKMAVSTSIDMTARLWDLATGRCIAVLDNDRHGATACAVSRDGRFIVIGSDQGSLARWDLESRRRSAWLEGHTDFVTACALTAAGHLVTASRDRTVRVWDLESGKCTHRFSGVDETLGASAQASEQEWITAVVALPEGEQIVAVSGSGALSRWSLASGRRLQQFGAGQGRVDSLAVLHGGSHLLCGTADGALAVWDLGAERQVVRIAAHAGAVSACAVSPDAPRVVSGSSDRVLRLWELGSAESLVSQDGHAGPVTSCAVTPDGRTAVSASEDGALKVWDISTGACRATLEGHADLVTACAISPDGRQMVSGARDGSVLLWTLDPTCTAARMDVVVARGSLVSGCAFLPGGRILTASQGGDLEIRSLSALDDVRILGPAGGPVAGVALTPDGALLLSIGRDGAATLWDVTTGHSAWRLVDVPEGILAGALTPDCAVLAFADGRIEVRDLRSQQLLRKIPAHARRVFGCAVSPDGARVISASEDGTVGVFSRETGRCLGIHVGTSWFRCVAATESIICAGDQEGNVWMLVAAGSATGAGGRRAGAQGSEGLSGDDLARLRDALARVYGSAETARLVVQAAGIDERRLRLSGSPRELWSAIIDEAAKRRRIAVLIRIAFREYPEDDDFRWAAELLAGE